MSLVDGPHFRLDRLDGAPDAKTAARYAGPLLVIPLDGSARIGGQAVAAGECALAGAIGDVSITGRCLIAQPF